MKTREDRHTPSLLRAASARARVDEVTAGPLGLFRHIREVVPGNAARFRVLRRLFFLSLTEYFFNVSRYRIKIGPLAPSQRFRFLRFGIRF